MLQCNDGLWVVFPRLPSPACWPKFSSGSIAVGGLLAVYLLHFPFYITDVQLTHTQFIMTNYVLSPIQTVPLQIPTSSFTLQSFQMGWLSGIWFLPPSQSIMEQLRDRISQGTCEAHSDRSFLSDTHTGSCSWGLSSSSMVPFALAAGELVPGP